MQYKTLIPVILVSIVLGFFVGAEWQKTRIPEFEGVRELINRDAGQPPAVDFSLFWDAWNTITERYVERDKLDTQAMVFGAIEGMVNSLGDPFTTFLKAEQSRRLQEDISGEFAGVGIEIGMRENALTVISPLRDTPAAKAGILAGDKITAIDGESTKGITLDDAVNKIRGRRGTKVVLTVSRQTDGKQEAKDIEIIRDRIKIPTVEWKKIDSGVGYIELSSFNQLAKSEFDKAVNELKKNGAGDRLILDLRNNPGGLLDLAIEISSYFLDPGEVVVIEDFGNGKREELKAVSNGDLKDVKVVVIINKGSASASEIVAGALHDNKGIKLIGEKTFGKGSVQQVEDLRLGTSLKVTVAKWLTPSGRSITDEGIEPDIEVEIPEEMIDPPAGGQEFEFGVPGRDPQLDRAIEEVKNL